MIKAAIWLVFLPILGLFSPLTWSANYTLERVHTQILFFCDHLGFSKSQGEFLKFSGAFVFDPDHPTESTAQITIDASSIDMDNQEWNDHMLNEDFFDVKKYPTIEFKSTRVETTSSYQAKVHGDLTVLGHTEPVILDVSHNKSGVHPFSGKYTAGFSATTNIQRSLFGMTYGLPVLGDNIEIRLEIEGQRISK